MKLTLGHFGENITGYNSAADRRRELFKPSEDTESHVVSFKRNELISCIFEVSCG